MVSNNKMKFLEQVEKITGLSGYAIAKAVGVRPSQYYRWKTEARSVRLRYLSGLASLPNMNWSKLGKMIDKEVEKEN